MDHERVQARTPVAAGEWLSSSLRKHLNDRLITTFDWRYGATRGPIHFVDYHLLELCRRRANDRQSFWTAMLSRIVQCARQLCDPGSGAMHQYLSRTDDSVARGYVTLLGQAVALRAAVLAGSLVPESGALGDSVFAFVERTGIHQADFGDPDVFDANSRNAFKQWRRHHYYWYLIAVHEYAVMRGLWSAANHAGHSASQILESRYVAELAIRGEAAPGFLDEVLALAFLGEYYDRQDVVAGFTSLSDTLAVVLIRYRVTTGGYSRLPIVASDRDAIVDIDLTIEIVRLATRLLDRHPSGPWRSIQQHGLSALGQPAIALARTVEAGILLIDEELRWTPSTGGPDRSGHRAENTERRLLNRAQFHRRQYD